MSGGWEKKPFTEYGPEDWDRFNATAAEYLSTDADRHEANGTATPEQIAKIRRAAAWHKAEIGRDCPVYGPRETAGAP